MYACRLISESGEGVIPELVYEGSYDQLVGYLREHLDQCGLRNQGYVSPSCSFGREA